MNDIVRYMPGVEFMALVLSLGITVPPVLNGAPPPGFYEQHDDAVETQLVEAQPLPPYDMDAEAAVLSAVILDPAKLPQARELLRPESFYSEAHRRIFEACCAVSEIDVVTVGSWLRENNRLAQVGGMPYLTEVLNAAPAVRNVESYAKIVRQKARLRHSILVGQKLQAFGLAQQDFTVPALKELEALVEPDVKQETSYAVPDRWLEEGPLVHEPTEIAVLDQYTGGGPVYGSRWYIVGAPDACKTALQVQLADVFARRGLAVGMLAVDEDPDDLETRFVQRLGFMRRECETRDPSTVKLMRDSLTRIHPIAVQYYGAEDTIESAAKKLSALAKRESTQAALFIDSAQTVTCDSVLAESDKEPSEYVRVTRNVWAIRAVASKYRMIVIATSEMNREGYKNGASAGMASAKQSGAIEYSARVMISAEAYGDAAPDVFKLRIQKNKHGPRDIEFALRLDRARMTLSNVDAPAPPPNAEDSRASVRAAREADEEQRRLQRRAKEKADREARLLLLEDVVVAVVGENVGIGAAKLRELVSARITGGCGKDILGTVVARCALKRRLVIEKTPGLRDVRHALPEQTTERSCARLTPNPPTPPVSQPSKAGHKGGIAATKTGSSHHVAKASKSKKNKMAAIIEPSSATSATSATSEKEDVPDDRAVAVRCLVAAVPDTGIHVRQLYLAMGQANGITPANVEKCLQAALEDEKVTIEGEGDEREIRKR